MDILKTLFLALLFGSGIFFLLLIIYVIARLVALAFVRTLKDQFIIGKDEKNEEEQKTIH